MRLAAIVTTHNSEKYLRACLESAMRECDEVFVIDNASTDGTLDIVRDLHVRSIVHTVDTGGPVEGYNEGIKWVTSDLVCFLDADDMLAPGTRSVMESQPEADWYVANLLVMNEDGWFTATWDYTGWPTTRDEARKRALDTLSLPVSMKGFFRRSWIESNNLRYVKIPGTEHSPDVATCFAWLDADPRIHLIPVPLVYYRTTPDTLAYHFGPERERVSEFIRSMTKGDAL
jgi:glycosyltransferase involved in cell wall biosynthesis